MTQGWSCGGGTQSAAIAALIIQGRLPKPDVAVMVDTEREKSSTWNFVLPVLKPALAQVGVELQIIKKSQFSEVDCYSKDEEKVIVPVFTLLNGQVGKGQAFCSGEWKRDVIMRYFRSIGVDKCRNWLGISLDEMHRIRGPRRRWFQPHYPLVFDVPMRRSDCIHLVVDEMGWPEPPKSACYICPNHDDKGWVRMKRDYPNDFSMAVEEEKRIQQTHPHIYFHKSCKPLDIVDFSQEEFGQTNLFGNNCDSGYCFV